MVSKLIGAHFEEDLGRRFGRVDIHEAHSNRSEFLLYLNQIHSRQGTEAVLRAIDEYSRHGVLPALAALAVQQFSRRTDDFALGAKILAELCAGAPHNGYVAAVYLESLLADAQVGLVEPEIITFLNTDGASQPDYILRRLARTAATSGAWGACERLLGLSGSAEAAMPFFWDVIEQRLKYAATFSGQSVDIPALVINLASDRRKLALSNVLYPTLGIAPERVEGIYGNDLSPEEAGKAVSGPGATLGRGALGCALSHVSAWETVAKADQDHTLVLEDDGLPFSRQDIGDLVSLAGEFDVLFVNERMSALVSERQEPGFSPLWETLRSRPDSMRGWGADAYILSRRGAAKLMAAVAQDGIVGHIDGQIGSYGIDPSKAGRSRAQQIGIACRRHLRSGVELKIQCLNFPMVASTDFGYPQFVTMGVINNYGRIDPAKGRSAMTNLLPSPVTLHQELPLQVGRLQGTFVVELDLVPNPEVGDRAILLRFGLDGTLEVPKDAGVMLSANPRAGYFSYVSTSSSTPSRTTITLPPDVSCVGVTIVPWAREAYQVEVIGASITAADAPPRAPQGAPFKSVRNVSRVNSDIHTHDSVEDFCAAESVLPGLHVIDCGGLPLEILYKPKNCEITSIVFNAALGQATQEIPRFMAGPTFEGLATNTVSVFDASLYTDDSLQLAWYAGSRAFRMQKVLPSILEKFVRAAGGNRTLLFGASGGGFAALYYAQFFTGSQVVVINPQTILENYIPRVVQHYLSVCWGMTPNTPIGIALKEHIVSDLRDVSLETQEIIYLQNSSDNHVEDHLLPYVRSASSHALWLLADEWGDGHVSPPRNVVADVLSAVVEHFDQWQPMLLGMGAIPNPDEAKVQARLSSINGA